jgi:hypothetical protein
MREMFFSLNNLDGRCVGLRGVVCWFVSKCLHGLWAVHTVA